MEVPKCPVCLEDLDPCMSFPCHHKVCGRCAPKLNNRCPECRCEGAPSKDHAMTNLLQRVRRGEVSLPTDAEHSADHLREDDESDDDDASGEGRALLELIAMMAILRSIQEQPDSRAAARKDPAPVSSCAVPVYGTTRPADQTPRSNRRSGGESCSCCSGASCCSRGPVRAALFMMALCWLALAAAMFSPAPLPIWLTGPYSMFVWPIASGFRMALLFLFILIGVVGVSIARRSSEFGGGDGDGFLDRCEYVLVLAWFYCAVCVPTILFVSGTTQAIIIGVSVLFFLIGFGLIFKGCFETKDSFSAFRSIVDRSWGFFNSFLFPAGCVLAIVACIGVVVVNSMVYTGDTNTLMSSFEDMHSNDDACDLQTRLKCQGWAAPCTPYSNSTSDPAEHKKHLTWCLKCKNDDANIVFEKRTTCRDAIVDEINRNFWPTVGASVGMMVLLVVTVVLQRITFRDRAHMEDLPLNGRFLHY